jgi:hypothetical protein
MASTAMPSNRPKPQPLRSVISPLVQNTLTFVGQSWPAYAMLLAAVPMPSYPHARRRNRVTRATQLCIEGPAGSGNSYFVNVFLMANPGTRVAHHHHVACQITRAVDLDIPAIALLRHPVDSVSSRTNGNPHMIGAMYRQWLRFFQAVDTCGDEVLLSRFDTVTSRPADVIQQVNRQRGTSFSDALPDEAAVFQAMDASFFGAAGTPGPNPNRPRSGRDHDREQTRRRVADHPLAPEAVAMYDTLVTRAR